ncbi:phosphotransferase enzyme family protein [Microbacterium sp. G2-8]|uniref:phosphotransferase enzyme family protein n=1 Tax=Microbacterium sp. G2-8 TaxID=2842454 RepID=UPI001C8AE264|nr:phosphotransferase [Microbacterium sp. G2-8]
MTGASSLTRDQADQLARAALPEFGFSSDARVEFVKHRENHTYKVTCPERGEAALRLHRRGYRGDAEISSEMRWIRLLSERGVSVPSMRLSADDTPFAVLRLGEIEQRVSAQEWLADARAVGDVVEWWDGTADPGSALLHTMGGLAADLHLVAEGVGTPAWFRRAAWDADGLAGEAPAWGRPERLTTLSDDDRRLFAVTRARVRAELTALPRDPRRYGIIHADITPENVLARGDDHVVIDFDDFGAGWFAFDLATIVWWLSHRPDCRELTRALLDGYTARRPLDAQDRAALEPLVVARALSYLGWAADRPGDPASEWISQTVAPWARTVCEAHLDVRPQPWH